MSTQTLSPEFAGPNADRPIAARLDHAFFSIIESLAALLLIGEICILFAGISARYVLHSPLVWSDELAQLMILPPYFRTRAIRNVASARSEQGAGGQRDAA
jgi:hypothetical protein